MDNRDVYYENETCEINFDNTLAGTILFTSSSLGCIFNIMAAYYLIRLPKLRNAFGILMSSHAISSAGVLATIALFYAPIIFFVTCAFSVSPIGFAIASSIDFYWYAAVFGQLAVAFNRCLAISSPVKYRRFFTNTNAVVIAIVAWMMGLLMQLWYVFGCATYIDPIIMGPNRSENECNDFSTSYGFYLDNSFVIILLLLDVFTMIRLREFSKRLNSNATGGAAQSAEKQRQRQEIRFFMQAFAIDLFMVINQINAGLAPFLLANAGKWTTFLVSALPFIVQHFIDALLILLINPEIRNRLCGKASVSATEITRVAPNAINVNTTMQMPKRSVQSIANSPMAMAPIEAVIYHG